MTRRLLSLAFALCGLLALAGCRGSKEMPLPQRIVDLSPALTADINLQRLGYRALEFLGTSGRITSIPIHPKDPAMAFGLRELSLPSHSGTHLDAPARLLRSGQHPADVRLDQVVGRARLVDLRWHDRHAPIQITDLELTPIQTDDVVLLYLGYEPPTGDEWPRFAPLSVQASEWLVAKKVRAVATDLPAIVRFDDIEERVKRGQPPEAVWAEYLPLFQANIPLIAGLINLDQLAGERSVVFAGFPLPIVDADGAPVRAAALVY